MATLDKSNGPPDKERVYAEVRSWITTGRMGPGSPVSERDLAQHFGISRTPIREVLHRLQLGGLIEIYANRGAFVRRLDARAIIEIFEVREALEPMAASLAAVWHDSTELAALRDRLEDLKITENARSLEESVLLGSELHDTIVRWAGNSILSEFNARLKDQASLIRLLTRRSREIEETSRTAHLAICDALGSRDRARAHEAMLVHLHETRSKLLSQFQPE